MQIALDAPVFIGGTGRSGTSIMAKLLSSHPEFCLPCHENKLIVERGGLIDIVEQLSGRYDILRNHFAVNEFITRAQKLRQFGFGRAELNAELQRLIQQERLGFQAAFETVQRSNPQAAGSIHAIGDGFGADHYWACVTRFVVSLATSASEHGIVDTDGLLQPFFITRHFTRPALLAECRRFLDELYLAPLGRAGAARWVDDTPQSVLYIDFLFELYPNMRFIHMIRDPREVVASFLSQVWAPNDSEQVVSLCAGMIETYRGLRPSLPMDRVLEVRLEDLVHNCPATLKRLADFLGVGVQFDANLVSQVDAHLGRRRDSLPPPAAAVVEEVLAGWMAEHQYEPDAAPKLSD